MIVRRASTSPCRRVRRGFTLAEAALTTAITGIAFVAIMQLFLACTQQNRIGSNMTTAMLLAENVQETMAGLAFNDPASANATFGAEAGQTLSGYDDIDDFDGKSFSPPIDSLRRQIPALQQFTQTVTVAPIYAMQPGSNTDPATSVIPRTSYTGAARVTVQIYYRSRPTDSPTEVFRTSWIRVDE